MQDLHKQSTLVLANRLNQISKEIQKLEIEHNSIVNEIKSRLPKLKDDKNLEEKVLKKVKEWK